MCDPEERGSLVSHLRFRGRRVLLVEASDRPLFSSDGRPRQDVDRATLSQLEASLTSPTDPDLIHVASLVLCRDMQTDDVDAYWAQLCRVSQLLEASRLLEQAQVVFVAQGVLPLCKTRVEPPKTFACAGFVWCRWDAGRLAESDRPFASERPLTSL